MYLPRHFEMADETMMFQFMDQWNFATLISSREGAITANQVPFLVDAGERCLYAHLARANSQWIDLESADDVVVHFPGPNAYVSPRWYDSKDLVPTWNFTSVQAKGRGSLIVEEERLLWILARLTARHESAFPHPWTPDEVPRDKLKAMLAAIVGIKVDIVSLEGKSKLSQNRNPADRAGVVRGLRSAGPGQGAPVAELMENLPD
jgi:transcriptional regulator